MPKLSTVRLTKTVVEAAAKGQCISDQELRGFRLIVSPAGSKRFVASYRLGGRSSMLALGTFPALTVDQAREKARQALGEVARGIDPAKAREALRKAPTLDDLAAEYLGSYAQSRGLSRSTLEGAKVALRMALPTYGKRRVGEFGITDIRKLHGDARSTGLASSRSRVDILAKALAAASAEGDARRVASLKAKHDRALARVGNRAGVYQANRLLAVLSKMFALAIERGWRADNPCLGVGKFDEDQRWRSLSPDEVGRLLDACGKYEAEHTGDPTAQGAADAIRLLLFTGARLREVLNSEWRQFDLASGLWEKPSSHTKSKRQHRLEVDGPALDLLKSMRERATHERFLFPGRPPLTGKASATGKLATHPTLVKPRADLKRPWRWIAREAGLQDVRLHDIRRTTASFMLSGGASLATVGKALGHTQASTTARYAHLSQTVQREGLRQAGEAMAALAGKERSTVTALR